MDSRQNQEKKYKLSLEEFEASNYDMWRQAVEKQLKGAPFEKKLVKKSSENIAIQPLYSKDVYNTHFDEMPGSFPFTRGTSAIPKTPHICQQINASTPQQLNKLLVHNTQRGQNGIYLKFDKISRVGGEPQSPDDLGLNGVSITTEGDIETALKGLDLSKLYLFAETGIAGSAALALLACGIEKLGFQTGDITGAILYDPHQQLMVDGVLTTPLNEIYADLANMLKTGAKLFPKCSMIGVDARLVRESGGSATEELAVAMASAVEYLKGLSRHVSDINQVAPAFQFSLTSGSDFFMEIAKFRAARKLWSQIVTSCKGDASKAPFKINAGGQQWNKTIYDPYVNMLRTTTESLAAIIGGADSLDSTAFDKVFSAPDEFSERIARNTQIILNEESHTSEVIDPAGGSWFIEKLTDDLARQAWQLFRSIEEQGGLIKALQDGFIQQKINELANQKKDRIAKRKDGIVGTSLFANIYEELPGSKETLSVAEKEDRLNAIDSHKKNRDNNAVKKALEKVNQKGDYFSDLVKAARAGATIQELHRTIFNQDSDLQVKALQKIRAAEGYEKLRNASEKYKAQNGEYPPVVLATIGPLSQHKLRADFTANFVMPAGFRTVETGIDSDAHKVIETVKKSSAKIVVICSTDETYAECVPPLTKALKEHDNTIQVIVAGFPKNIIDDLKAAGVYEFLHIKSNNLQLLEQLQKKAGVA